MDSITTIEQLNKEVIEFRNNRNWKKFHDPKNLSIGLSIEAAELQELFLWKSADEVKTQLLSEKFKQELKEEVADIFIFLLYFCEACNIDLSDAVLEKIKINAEKYPVDKSYDSKRKYTELGD